MRASTTSGPEAEPLHHAGTKALDQRIGTGEQVEHISDDGLILEVELDHLAAPAGDRLHGLARSDAIERHHLRAHVGQQHAGERSRTDAGELDDAKTCERACGAGPGVWCGLVEHVLMSLACCTALSRRDRLNLHALRLAFPDPLIVPRVSGQRKRAVCRKATRRASLRAVWNLICRFAE
ncbi:hypothetical protein ACVIJ6_001800 [Bradyrhizobium sp. USDA 4369]